MRQKLKQQIEESSRKNTAAMFARMAEIMAPDQGKTMPEKVKLPMPEIPRLNDVIENAAIEYMPEIDVTAIHHHESATGWIFTGRFRIWHVIHPASGKVFAEYIRAVIRTQRDLNKRERDGSPTQ